MPFSENGIRPDLIINPHAFPSRMTMGMLIESMCGKVASHNCEFYDATPFSYTGDVKVVDEVGKLLVKNGMNYYGNELMYSGITGEQFECDIFMGVVFYQRLRHMVGDKYQVRSTGKLNNLTHQPLKGRKKGGGIRLGEMERDGLLGHGVSFILRDRFMSCSDGFETELCKNCGSMMFTYQKNTDSDSHINYCSYCKISGQTVSIYVPYALKYLAAELASMNILLSFTVED